MQGSQYYTHSSRSLQVTLVLMLTILLIGEFRIICCTALLLNGPVKLINMRESIKQSKVKRNCI